MLRFQKLEDDEQTRMDQKSLKQKKELLKQEFEHQEEIKKYDNQSIVSSNDFKFKAELDKLQALNSKKKQELTTLQKSQLSTASKSRQTTSYMHASTSSYGCIRSINNNHSDPLFEIFSANLRAKYPEDLEAYQDALKEQEGRYDNLILEEEEKSESLCQILTEIEKSKLILQQKVEELEILTKMALKRFGNTETLEFLAVEKNGISKKNLRSIKGELLQMKQMQDFFKKTQEGKQSDLQKVIYVGEENIGHNVLKMEEAELKKKHLEEEIEKLSIQEQRILKKKQKSRYILTYIECFDQFERIFMNRTKPEERRLVDQYTVDEEMIQNPPTEVHFESHTASQMEHDFDRNELLSQINNFYSKGEGRAQTILDFMLENYWHLQSELSKSSLEYENLLKTKNVLLDEIENLDWEIGVLKEKNPDLEIHEQSLVAEDAGLLTINHETTTLNIKKMEVEEHSEKVLMMKATKAQGLLMKFQLGLAEFLHRVFQIISAIDNKNKDVKKFKYSGLIQEISNFDQFFAQIYHSIYRKMPNAPIEGHIDIQPQHLNLFAVNKTFQDVFQCSKKEADQASNYLYVQCKTDQILWFHLTLDNLKSFLEELQQNNNGNNNFNKLFGTKQINQFRDNLILIFIKNFQALLLYYQTLYQKVKDISSDLLVHLKENNPKFDASKLTRIIPRESQDIKSAKDLIIKRMMEYKTGEIITFKRENTVSFKKPKTEEDTTQTTDQIQMMQPESNNQLPIFDLRKKDFDDEQLSQIKSFFRAKIKQKHDEKKDEKKEAQTEATSVKDSQKGDTEIKKKKVEPNRIDRARSKKLLEQRNQKSIHKDELEQEREQMKAQIIQDYQKMQEEKERKLKPEHKETQNERKTQIKQATERLYGERGYTVQIMRNMAVTTNILSDINQLEHFPSKIEQPQLVGAYIMQKKNMHRNLNKDLTLPTLSYLKPTSAYFSRRNQSSEQIKALDYKRYYEIENGVGSRPQTQQISRKPITKQSKSQFNTEEYKKKYAQKAQTLDFSSKLPMPIDFQTQEGPKSCLVPPPQ